MNPLRSKSSPRLAARTPFDGPGLLRYFSQHAIPGVELGDDSSFRRPIRFADGRIASLLVTIDGPDGVAATVSSRPLPAELVPRVRRLLNLDANAEAIDSHLAADPALAPGVGATPGIRLPGCLDPQEQLLRTMIGQQISVAAARTVLGRLAETLDGTGMFPTAELLAQHGPGVLRGPRRRAAAIHGLACALASGALRLSANLTPEELTERLLAFPGVGPWTAGYVTLRVLGASDVLLSNDLVLLKGAARLGLPDTPKGIEAYAQRWAPFRSYAGMHLWRAGRSPELWPHSA